jgi:5-methylcytosine-specific restriction endonuclease McrA
MYCSELCQEMAELIRYVRACRGDGRISQPDVKVAIRTKLALVLGGGYPEMARSVPDDVRAAVYERANWLCEECGATLLRFTQRRGEGGHVERTFFRLSDGEPAEADLDAVATIQHCNGNSNDPAELKAFCKRCNNADAESKMVPVADDSPQAAMGRAIVARWEAPSPIRLCDDEVNWKTQWRVIRKQALAALVLAG